MGRVLLPQRRIALEDGVHFIVGHARARADDAAHEFGTEHPALPVQADETGERVTVLPFVQRARAVGEGFGQHGQHAVGEVYARAALVRLLIGIPTPPHIVRNVRDVHAEEVPLFGAGKGHGVVEVARVIAVDGDDRLLPEVAAHTRNDALRSRFFRFREGAGRECLGQPRRGDERVLLHFEVAAPAEHAHDLPLGRPAVGVSGDAHEHLFARHGARAARDTNLVAEPALVRLDEPALLLAVIGSRKLLHAAGDDGMHARLVAAFAADEHRVHRIAVQRAVHAVAGQEQVLPSVLAQQEAEPALVALHGALDEPEFIGGDEPTARVAHERARPFQRFKRAAERVALAAVRNAEQARDLVRLFVLQLPAFKAG